MGLKKITEMRLELEKNASALLAFTAAAQQFIEAHGKITAAHENVEKLRAAQLSKVQALPTLGVKEFEDYKQHLVKVYGGWSDRPLPLKPLEAVVATQRKAVDDAVQARVAKLAASFPGQVKPGMVFRYEPTKTLWEITSEGEEAKNANLKGDEKTWFKYQAQGAGPGSTSLATLKKSCKYIKV